jgi:Sigma factor regulator C-terminal
MIPGHNESQPILTSRKQAHPSNLRNRLGRSGSILFTLLIFIILYGAIIILLSIYNLQSGRDKEFERYATALIEMHDGVRVESSSANTPNVTPLLSQKVAYKLYQNVGEWQVNVGEATVIKSLFGKYKVSYQYNQKYIREYINFTFSLPFNLLYDVQSTPVKSNHSEHVWKQIRQIEDGHVATMAFSLSKGMDPTQLQQRLEKYNLDLLSMPVYAGELKDIKGLQSSSSGSSISTSTLTLRPAYKYTDQGNMKFEAMNDQEAVQESISQMLIDLEWLINNGSYDNQALDKLRLQYLKTNGVKVYGAVVTGPIRELEKLQQETDFLDFKLGKIEVWNWRND